MMNNRRAETKFFAIPNTKPFNAMTLLFLKCSPLKRLQKRNVFAFLHKAIPGVLRRNIPKLHLKKIMLLKFLKATLTPQRHVLQHVVNDAEGRATCSESLLENTLIRVMPRSHHHQQKCRKFSVQKPHDGDTIQPYRLLAGTAHKKS